MCSTAGGFVANNPNICDAQYSQVCQSACCSQLIACHCLLHANVLKARLHSRVPTAHPCHGLQVEQPFWAQPQHGDGTAPPEQQWERSVDNPTFVETAAVPWGTPSAPDAVAGISELGAGTGKQPAYPADAELLSATEAASVDPNSWPQQQPEHVIDGSDAHAWQPQANGWHAEGGWQGEGGQQADGGWLDGSAQAQVPDQLVYSDAPPAQWDPASQQGGDQSQLGEYGQPQQQPSQEQYAGLKGWAPDAGAQAQWDASQGQQADAQQADAGAQQAYEGWGNAEGQQWQGYDGGDTAQVRLPLRSVIRDQRLA